LRVSKWNFLDTEFNTIFDSDYSMNFAKAPEFGRSAKKRLLKNKWLKKNFSQNKIISSRNFISSRSAIWIFKKRKIWKKGWKRWASLDKFVSEVFELTSIYSRKVRELEIIRKRESRADIFCLKSETVRNWINFVRKLQLHQVG
jgi:hypothetical protein